MANPAPVIGAWYRKRGGETFEVVAIDPNDRTIEIVPSDSRLWADPLQYVDRGEISGYSEIELPESPDELERY
jgi:hypothetical protein